MTLTQAEQERLYDLERSGQLYVKPEPASLLLAVADYAESLLDDEQPAPVMPANASPLLVDLVNWADEQLIADWIDRQQAAQQAATRAQLDTETDPDKRSRLILRLADQVLSAYAETTEEQQIAELLREVEVRHAARLGS